MWSELPYEILELIVKRLNLADQIRFSAVCILWRQCAAANPPSSTIPWLMLFNNPKNAIRHFLSLPMGFINRKIFPELRSRRCIGSFEDWLIMVDTQGPFLFNHFLRAQIQLPSQRTLPLCWPLTYTAYSRYSGPYYIRKGVLSADPTSDEWKVVIIYGNDKLAFCKQGDQRWSVLIHRQDPRCRYQDAIFYMGQLYALDFWKDITVFDLGIVPVVRSFDVPPELGPECGNSEYLVESCGELLMISRIHRGTNPNISSTAGFQVFELDRSGPSWVEKESLPGHALFLSRSCSKLISSRDFSEFRENCIYYTDDRVESDIFDPPTGVSMELLHLDMGVFHMPSKSFQSIIGMQKLPMFFFLFQRMAV